MAASRPARLTRDELELFTDVMLGKLAYLNVVADADGKPLRRDEIFQVIIDTEILVTDDDPGALLERWASESEAA